MQAPPDGATQPAKGPIYAAPANDPATNALWKGPCSDFRCGNLGDFLDVVVGPDGTATTALVDSCPTKDDACITDLTITTPRGEAVVGQLVGGPSLRGGGGGGAGPGPGGVTACASTAGFNSTSVRPSGRGLDFRFDRRVDQPVTVDVFQTSQGRRVVRNRRVARFTTRRARSAGAARARSATGSTSPATGSRRRRG